LAQLQIKQRWRLGVPAVWSRTIAEAEATESVEMKGLAMKNYILPAFFAAAVLSSAPAIAADLKPVTKAPPPVSYNPFDVAIGGAIMSDYNFRGISQTARGPGGTVYIEGRYKPVKDVEWYAGSQVWTVKLLTDPTAEVDLYGGVRLTWDKWLLDLGAMYYWYPRERQVTNGVFPTFIAVPNGSVSLAETDFLEFYGKLTYTFNDNFALTGAVYYTNNWLNSGASGVYYSGIAKYTGTALPSGWNWYLSGELAYYDLGTTKWDPIAFNGPNFSGFDLPSYMTWNVGIGFTYKAMTLDLRYYDTNLSKEECYVLTADPGATFGGTAISITNPGGLQSKWCGAAFIGKLSFDTTLSSIK
jgi:uncharacterized protein (TIGR02001 family)